MQSQKKLLSGPLWQKIADSYLSCNYLLIYSCGLTKPMCNDHAGQVVKFNNKLTYPSCRTSLAELPLLLMSIAEGPPHHQSPHTLRSPSMSSFSPSKIV